MRGKVGRLLCSLCQLRITPAHAGKREIHGIECGVNEDHPRACGEKRSLLIILWPREGSPPRMRGKV